MTAIAKKAVGNLVLSSHSHRGFSPVTATANRVVEPFQRFFLGSQATMLSRLLLMNFIGKVLSL